MKHHTLWHKIADTGHLKRAARQCMARRSAAGSDGVSWARYRENFSNRISALEEGLRNKTWNPGPVRKRSFEYFTGKTIEICIPTVETRIVHRALRNVIEPCFEDHVFEDFVSGFRPKRSRLTAVRQAHHHLALGSNFVADIDVAAVSEGVSLESAVGWLSVRIADGSVLWLARKCLSGLPTPLAMGSGLSPLLINVRLSQVDVLLRDLPIVRFADNYCVFSKGLSMAESHFLRVVDALRANNLSPSLTKSGIKRDVNAEDLFLANG